jgi:DNA-binding CsgD family transcriptional regulator
VGVLLSARPREAEGIRRPLRLERTLPEDATSELSLAPLGHDALVRMLHERFGTGLSHPLVERVAATSGGNPFYALEIAGALIEEGARPAPAEPLPVPEDLGSLLRARLESLPRDAQDVLSACAALARPRADTMERLFGGRRGAAGTTGAADAGIVEVHAARINFTHPLLSAAVYGSIPPDRRRALHKRLAEAVEDTEERARHLALGAEGPDPVVAAALDDAARRARSRGAPATGAELLELAGRLTPSDDPSSFHRRAIEAGEYHFEAGDVARARSLLEEVLAASPPGPRRAEALFHLANIAWGDLRRIRPLLQRALAEVGETEPVLGSRILAELTWTAVFGGNLPEGSRHARAALESAERAGDPESRCRALVAVGHAEFFMGHDVNDLMTRAIRLQDTLEGLQRIGTPRRVRAAHLAWTGELDTARRKLEREYQETVEHGQLTTLWEVLAYLAELEVRAGNWDAAARYASEGQELMAESGVEEALERLLTARALVEAHRGEVDAARRHAAEALRLATSHDYRFEVVRSRSVLGFLELSLENPAAAHAYLKPLPDLVAAMGLGEPGVFPFVPDEIEALVGLGEIEQAESRLGWLEERGEALDRPLARATAARCRGPLAPARGDFSGAGRHLGRALAEHERARQPFEWARTVLIAAEIRRRAKQRRLAREGFVRAVATVDRLGARLWSERARRGLRRVGGKAASPAGLTPTEQRIAELVAEGRTNREVSDALFVSVKTVEANLSRVYHKLGVRSRTELVRRMAATDKS